VPRVSREQLFAAFFFAVFLFLLFQIYLFLAPFSVPLIWAAILALTFYPLTLWLVDRFGGRRGLAAFVLVAAVTVGAILPAFLLGSVLVGQAADAYQRVQQLVRSGEFPSLIDRVRASPLGALSDRFSPLLAGVSIDLSDLLLRATNWVSNQIINQAASLARNVLVSVFNFTIMLVALFFFFRDGEAMAARLKDLLPMERAHKEAVFNRLYTTLTAVVQSMVVTAATQGVLAGLGYWLIGGLGLSIFLGFLTGLASFLPLAGPAIVWASTAIYLALTGHVGRALGLVAWGALAVSTADNWIKPLFIGGRAKLPTFPLLIAILGGLQVYGFLGVFLGPVLLAILFVFIDIYREEYPEEPPLIATASAIPPPEHIERVASS
jgi:predicted PurR-regulated permease PerM